jgi:FtsH-binding integral membrane protein
MASLAVGAGICQAMVARGTTAALALTAVLLFVLGLEVMEPLAQEVDQPDRTDGLPVERGDVMLRLVVAPAVALIPFAAIAAVAATITLGTNEFLAATVILALPTVMAGAAGAVVSIVRDAPDPFGSASQAFMPPEMAGVSTALRTLLPIVVSGLGAASVILVRYTYNQGDSTVGAAIRGAIGAVLLAAAIAFWMRKRDRWRATFRTFMADGRAYTSQQRSTPTR